VAVLVSASPVPAVSMAAACARAEGDPRACCATAAGNLLANVGSRITFAAASSANDTTFEWAVTPPLAADGGGNGSAFVSYAPGVFVLQVRSASRAPCPVLHAPP
jgi:hypothetical protein